MISTKLERTRGSLLLLVATAAVLLAIGGTTVSDALRYEREAILAGQVWRLLTAPLVHLGWSHLLMNIIGLLIIWGLFGQVFSNRDWGLISVICTLGIGLSLLLLNPNIGWYVGLSGLLHGYFAAGAVAERCSKQRTYIWLLGLLVAKLLWEQTQGPIPGSMVAAGGNVLVDAHLYGAISGLPLGWLFSRTSRRSLEEK